MEDILREEVEPAIGNVKKSKDNITAEMMQPERNVQWKCYTCYETRSIRKINVQLTRGKL